MARPTMIELSALIEDLTLYPRTAVSSVNTSNLASALRAGCKLPPIVVDRESKRIVDGFHRRRAYLQVFGPDARVPVELIDFADETEMFCTAVKLNTAHGLPLQEIEKRKIVLRLQDNGIEDEAIATTLHIPVDKVEKIRIKVATVVKGNGESIRVEPLKRSVFHFQGRTMSESQAKAQKSAPGTSYVLLISQLREALREELINREDGRITDELRALAAELEEYLTLV